MDAVDVFRQLAGNGVRFDANRFGQDMGFFKTGVDVGPGGGGAHLMMQATPASSLDFFGSQKKKQQEGTRKRRKDKEPVEEEGEGSAAMPKRGKRSKSGCPEEGPAEDQQSANQLNGQLESGAKRNTTGSQQERDQVNHLRREHRITAKGGDVPAPITSFAELEGSVRAYLLRNIHAAGYTVPTPVQMQAIPILLRERELMAVAPTGSGKTAAYLLPILSKLKHPEKASFRAVIVSPTRELAQQIYREIRKLSKGKEFRVCVLTKANANTSNFSSNSSRFDLLVTTPMRLVHLIRTTALELSSVQHLVLDEADKLLEMGFMEQVDEIIAACTNQSVQRSLWSATMPPVVEELARTFLRDPVHLTVGAHNAATTTIKQRLEFVGREEGKLLMLRQMILQGIKPPVLIFVQSKDRAKELFRELIYDGLKVDVIHSERTQAQRDAIIKNFRSGAIWILICTDLMARGIDFRGVSSVINYDFPQTTQEYIHRIGRTGRAGRSGESITFFTEDDVVMIRSIANVMKNSGCYVPEWILNVEKAPKSKRKEIAKRPIQRKHIETVSTFDLKQGRKKRKEKLKRFKKKSQTVH